MVVSRKRLMKLLAGRGLTLVTAESCTGGRAATFITEIPGCSVFYKGGVIAYSNQLKEQLLGVSPKTIMEYGAVSEETVREMVLGAMQNLHADAAIATSGIAGPGGGTREKPVGTIWIAVALRNQVVTYQQTADRGREENMDRAVRYAFNMLMHLLADNKSH